MPPWVDDQSVSQCSIRDQPFMYHLRQKHDHDIVVTLAWHIHRNLNPPILSYTLPSPTFPLPFPLHPSHLFILPSSLPVQVVIPAIVSRHLGFLHFGLYANNGFGAVCEAESRAPVRRG